MARCVRVSDVTSTNNDCQGYTSYDSWNQSLIAWFQGIGGFRSKTLGM